jgi:hypothetical protein
VVRALRRRVAGSPRWRALGCVAELGSHEELMAADGGYAELYALQARAYA